jgi:hypothetical protein
MVVSIAGALGGHHLNRAAGALFGALKVGPGARNPSLHRALHRMGVLQRDPATWEDSPLIDALPWGGRRVAAPPPDPPGGVHGPWPQRPILGPDFYPTVLNIPDAARGEHFRYNASRYLGQIVGCAPGAAARALCGPRLEPLDDEAFVRSFTHTSMGQFVRLGVDDADRPGFDQVMRDECAAAAWATIDLTLCPVEHLLPGIHAAPSLTLLRRVEGDAYRVVAIRIRDRVLYPADGPAWALAKCFVLQGGQCRLVMSAHPRLHFAVDALNAITGSVLAAGHVVRRLLDPHRRFTLGLHEGVLHHRRSVVHNSQREIYTPFPFRTEGMHAMIGAGCRGVPGKRAYPPYRFDDGLLGDHVPYGRYRRAWFDLLCSFVDEVVPNAPREDEAVRIWADHIAPWIPGFPSGDEILRDDNFVRCLASYIATVTVYHTGDHHSYAGLALESMPFRLRVAPPHRAGHSLEPHALGDDLPRDRSTPRHPPPTWARLDFGALVSPEDFFRHQLGHAMFYKPVVLESLRRVRYALLGARHQTSIARARRAMDGLDAEWAGSSFPSSHQIGSSLQY